MIINPMMMLGHEVGKALNTDFKILFIDWWILWIIN